MRISRVMSFLVTAIFSLWSVGPVMAQTAPATPPAQTPSQPSDMSKSPETKTDDMKEKKTTKKKTTKKHATKKSSPSKEMNGSKDKTSTPELGKEKEGAKQ